MNDCPETLLEAVRYFSDLDTCHDFLRKIRWPRGPVCPHCESRNVGPISRQRLRCKDCRKDVRDKAGTIFEDSPLGLDKWFVALWSVVNCKNGVSSHELARALGVTQKTAWFMAHRCRKALEEGGFDKFDGPAEADTTYIGGKASNRHAIKRTGARGTAEKTAVHGVLQRTGESPSQVRCEVIASEDASQLLPAVRRNVRYGAAVFTDAARAYSELCLTHRHESIDHSVCVAPFHLRRYIAEQAFRFNRRVGTDASRFVAALAGVVGKRLTYRELAGIDDAGFMGLS